MNKKRKNQAKGKRHEQSALVDRNSDAFSILARYALPIFVVALLAYLLLYFTAPAPSILRNNAADSEQLTRIDMAMWLTMVQLPELWGNWTAGSAENIGLAGRLGVLTVAVTLLVMAAIIGWLFVDLLSVNLDLRYEEVLVFSLAVGLNVLSLLTLLVGLLGQLQNLFAYTAPVAALLIVAGLRFRKRVFARKECASEEIDEGKYNSACSDWLPTWVLWLAAPFVIVLVAGAIVPPREFDVREYHLQAPKEWFQQGAITFMPHNVYANMPLGPQILSLPAMAIMPGEMNWWWGALVGKVIIASYVPLTALALFTCGRRFFNTTAGVVAALAYISVPWMAHVSIETYVDGALACYLFLAFYAMWLAVSIDAALQPKAERLSAIGLAGFLAGAAVSCKYPGLLFVVMPLLATLLLRKPWSDVLSRTRLTHAVVFVIAVMAGCGLWLGKNWVLSGNPTYPLLYGVFGGETRTSEKDEQWSSAHAVPPDSYGNRYSLGQVGEAVRQITINSPWISPILVPLAGVAFFRSALRQKLLPAAGLLIFIVAAWFLLTHRIDRFWIPALPLLALIAGAGVLVQDSPWWRRIVIAVLFWGLAWNLAVVVGLLTPPKMLVSLDSLQKDPARIHPAHIWLNKNVPDGKAVLLVGDAQPFDLNVPALYNTCFDDSVFEDLMKDKSTSQRRAALSEQNISHIFVQWSEIDRYRSPGNYGYTEYVTRDLFRELVSQGLLTKPLGRKLGRKGQADPWVGEIYPVNTLGD